MSYKSSPVYEGCLCTVQYIPDCSVCGRGLLTMGFVLEGSKQFLKICFLKFKSYHERVPRFGSTFTWHFRMADFLFLTFRLNKNIPISTFPVPEHFLGHFAFPLQLSPRSCILNEQRHSLFPKITFSFLKTTYKITKSTLPLFFKTLTDAFAMIANKITRNLIRRRPK